MILFMEDLVSVAANVGCVIEVVPNIGSNFSAAGGSENT
jgi:hypothetical protein